MTLLVGSAVKVAILLAAALIGRALLRRRSAALRHWLLASAVACGAALPALELVAPSWQLALPAPRPPHDAGPAAAPAAASADAVLSRPAPRSAPVAPRRPAAAVLLASVWAIGAGAAASLLAIGFARLKWVAARARPADRARQELADRLARERGVRRTIRLLQSDHPSLLVTWGVWRPVILLPSAATAWTEERLRIVLCHELAHVRRADWAAQLASEVLRAIYWFNPLTWLAAQRLRRESELAADDAVLAAGVDPADYAGHLLDLARTLTEPRRIWCAAPAMARPSSLERRIRVMLNARIDRAPLSRSSRLAVGLAALGVAVAVAGGVLAQGTPAIVSVSVVDPSGAPLSDATVSLTHRQAGTTHAGPTNGAGAYEVTLPPGEYTLEARAVGFATLRDVVQLAAGERVQRSIRLNLGTVQESITVSAASAPPPSRPARMSVESFRERFLGKRLQPPIKLKDVRPLYSPALAASGVEGRVVLEGRIGTDGTIAGLKTVSGHPELVEPARDAVSQWQFEPTRLWGSAVETDITITVDFKRQN